MGSRQRTYERHIDDQAKITPIFQPDTGLAIPTFLPTDDPLASLNKAMMFLSSVYRSKFHPTNNQLRTLSNLRTQATIQNGQVLVQNVQGANQPMVIRCYNCKGKGHMAKQCTARKRDFLADGLKETDDCEDLQLQATTNFNADRVDAYDSDCDDEAITNAIFMANLSPISSINGDTVKPCYDSNIFSESYDELTSSSNVISYADYMVTVINDEDTYVPPPVQNNDRILSVIEHMKTQVEKCSMENQETQSVNESLTSKLDRYKEIVKTLENESKRSASDREKF
ncbi:retrovirus-related pol polyprotein from transposon TNT 1-94 [Tanacetum coccineum]